MAGKYRSQLQHVLAAASLDALQEFKVESGLLRAEYGRATAHVNVSTRSGVNQVHGSAFEFLRNSPLDAKNFFDNAGIRFRRSNATSSAPRWRSGDDSKLINGKDKFFFYFDYEGLRERKALTQTGTVPPCVPYGKLRRSLLGDLRSYDEGIQRERECRLSAGVPGNAIPANRIDPISAKISRLIFRCRT